jgi:predicted nuclease with TOPRIM domain
MTDKLTKEKPIISKRTMKLQQDKQDLRDKIKQMDREYKLLEGNFNALQIEYDKQTEHINKLQRGGLWYYTNENGYIYKIIHVEGYFDTTYEQIIPTGLKNALGNRLYNAYPFGKVVNGEIVIDIEQYKKYKGAILL